MKKSFNILKIIYIILFIGIVSILIIEVTHYIATKKHQIITTVATFTISDFQKIKLGTPYSDIQQRFGTAKDIGSGIHIFVYNLSDGSQVLLGFADLNSLMYIKHKLIDGTIKDINQIQVSDENVIKYEMITSINSQYSYPQIINYSNKEIMDKVNLSLSETFKNQGCDLEVSNNKTEWNVKLLVDYSKNDIFSVNASGNYDCGGPYPTNNYSSTLTFDMKNGEQISFEKLFKDYEKDNSQIIHTVYGDLITKSSDYIKKHPEASDCGGINTLETLKSYSQNYRLRTATKTISVRPDYPHVIESCIQETEIPVEKLLPFINGNSILNRI